MLSGFLVSAQDYIDSLDVQLRESKSISAKVATINQYYPRLRMDSASYAHQLSARAFKLSNQLEEDDTLRSTALYNYGSSLFDRQLFDSSIYYYQQAYDKYLNRHDTLSMIQVLAGIGINRYKQGSFTKALDHYLQAIEMAEKINHQPSYFDLNNRIAFLFIEQEQLDKGIEYLLKSYDASRSLVNIQLVKTIFNLANVMQRAGRLQESLQYLDTMIIHAEQLNFEFGLGKAYGMKAYTLMDLKEFEASFEAINKAQTIFDKMGITVEVVQLILAKARIHQEKKEYGQMLPYILNAKDKIHEVHDQHILFEYYEAAYICYKNLGRYDLALSSLEISKSLNDSIFKLENATTINELTTKYETEKKDQEIQNLTQQAQIQALKLTQSRFILFGTIGITLVILVVIYILVRQGKLRREQHLSQLEQKLLRIQMNPHFIFNVLGSIQNFMLKNDTQKAGIYLAKFAKLIRQTLEFSRDEVVSLTKEIEHIEHYIEVHKLLSNHGFKHEIVLDKSLDADSISIPPMFAQPFIENAIEHGKIGESSEGQLRVSLIGNHRTISLTIEDNGRGLSNGQHTKHRSLATQITKERLAFLEREHNCKLEFTINTNDELDSTGTIVRIQLPIA